MSGEKQKVKSVEVIKHLQTVAQEKTGMGGEGTHAPRSAFTKC